MEKEVRDLALAAELKKQNISEEKRKQILRDVREKIQRDKTMKLSIKEGSFASIMTGLGDSYIIPYALTLNANSLHIGMLKSFSGLLPPITQVYGSKLMDKYSRKKVIITYIALQALMWFPILLLSLFFWKSIFISLLPFLLISFYTLYAVFGSIATPSWFSLMGDIVPDNIRGKYFGKRNRIVGAIALIATLAGAFVLDFFKTKGLILVGFSILFLIAGIARFVSVAYFKKHYETKYIGDPKLKFSFFKFLTGIKNNNFSKFSLFVAVMYFSVMIASPFFSVYMLQELGFNYVTFISISLSSSLSSLIMMPVWGKFSDKYGRREVLIVCSILVALMPLLWLFSSSPYYLAFPNIIGGIGWSGFGLASFNFIYDSVSPKKRGISVAYYNILIGIGIFIGSIFGGLLLQDINLTFIHINKFLTLFIISAALRGLTAIVFLPKVREVRRVRRFNPILSFKRLKITHEPLHEIVNGIHLTKERK